MTSELSFQAFFCFHFHNLTKYCLAFSFFIGRCMLIGVSVPKIVRSNATDYLNNGSQLGSQGDYFISLLLLFLYRKILEEERKWSITPFAYNPSSRSVWSIVKID